MADRTCEQCKGTIPSRTHRQRNDKGQLVCDECVKINTAKWATVNFLTPSQQVEFDKRAAEALRSITRTAAPNASEASMKYLLSLYRQHGVPEGDSSTTITVSDVDEILNHGGRARGVRVTQRAVSSAIEVLKGQKTAAGKVAHDSGDNALIHHCPFCGSGAVTGGSDGSVDCDYCHSVFTVQVQPKHPNMPQTIDGAPQPPPGMPAGQETELSAPVDPAVEETEEGAATDPLGDAALTPEEEKPSGPVPPQFRKGSRTAAGFPEPEWVECPHCHHETAWWDDPLGNVCDNCRKTIPAKPIDTCTCESPYRPNPDCPEHHMPVSLSGWTCDVCGRSVNGQTDEEGRPIHQGDSVRHAGQAAKKSSKYFTTDGEVLDAERYLTRLALDHADDRLAVLAKVRAQNEA